MSAEPTGRIPRPADAVPAPAVAVCLPCFNEQEGVGPLVAAFRTSLPDARVYVYDNNSTDATVQRALAAGASVHREPEQGKGRVVERMFSEVEADIYVIVDADLTYDVTGVPAMVDRLLHEQLDMVVGRRVPRDPEAFRPGHALGNRIFNQVMRALFRSHLTDVLSGLRVLSRRFVKSFPVTSAGFEIETEITAHALVVDAKCAEIDTPYGVRGAASESKLRTYRDGLRILGKNLSLAVSLRPLRLLALLAAVCALAGGALGAAWLATDTTALGLAAAVLTGAALVSLATGAVLEGFAGMRRDARRLAYLAIPHPAVAPTIGR